MLPAYWRGFVWALLALAALGAIITAWFPDLSGLYLLALYSAPSNSLLPVPHEPGLLLVAQYYDPVPVALAACLGTCLAAAVDYPVVRAVCRNGSVQRAREGRWYRRAERAVMRFPFATIVVFAATPLPFYVVRVLAPAAGYPVWRYIVATAVGRFPRYVAIAWLGSVVEIPAWVLAGLFVALAAALVFGGRGVSPPEAGGAPAGSRRRCPATGSSAGA